MTQNNTSDSGLNFYPISKITIPEAGYSEVNAYGDPESEEAWFSRQASILPYIAPDMPESERNDYVRRLVVLGAAAGLPQAHMVAVLSAWISEAHKSLTRS